MDVALEIEKSVIGCVLANGNAYHAAWEAGVREGDFRLSRHRAVWRAIESLSAKDEPIDTVTVSGELLASGAGREVSGGDLALLELSGGAESIHVAARQLRDEADARRIKEAALLISSTIDDRKLTPGEVLAQAQTLFLGLNRRSQAADYADRSAAIASVLESAGGRAPGALPTGFPDIDVMLRGGMRGGQLIVVGARPGMGKSAIGLQIMAGLADEGIPVAFFSLEMTATELVEREVVMHSRVPSSQWHTASRDDMAKVSEAAAIVRERSLFIVDKSGMSSSEVCSKARRLVGKHGVQAVCVDYLGLMKGDAAYRASGDRTNEVGSITQAMKGLAMELDIPVLLLAQLNRGVESRQDKRPMLSDLRDSGTIEQDANAVGFLYRDGYYNKDLAEDERQITEFILAKNRSGPTGTAMLRFYEDQTRFASPKASIRRDDYGDRGEG